MSQTIQLRQKNPDETDSMAKVESEADVYGFLSRELAEQLGEYMSVTLSQDAGTEVSSDSVSGSGTGNYLAFETSGGNVVGFGVHFDILEDVLDFTTNRRADGTVTNAPESINMSFSPSTEEDYEQTAEEDSVDEDEAAALISEDSSSNVDVDKDEDEDDEAEELVIDDEELGLEA